MARLIFTKEEEDTLRVPCDKDAEIIFEWAIIAHINAWTRFYACCAKGYREDLKDSYQPIAFLARTLWDIPETTNYVRNLIKEADSLDAHRNSIEQTLIDNDDNLNEAEKQQRKSLLKLYNRRMEQDLLVCQIEWDMVHPQCNRETATTSEARTREWVGFFDSHGSHELRNMTLCQIDPMPNPRHIPQAEFARQQTERTRREQL